MNLPLAKTVENHEFKLHSLPTHDKARAASERNSVMADSLSAGVGASFQMFNRIISNLAQSHQQLEERVAQLTRELEVAKESGRREVSEKERFAQQLSTLLSLLPAGVVVIDGQGRVQQCNPAATDLLGRPLEGMRWVDIITRSFAPREDDGHEVSLKDGRRVSISTRSLESEPGQLVLLHDMTETRELQAQLSRNERLSSMGRMVASLAHQVRTPLSAAMLYAGHLSHPELAPQLRIKCAEKLMSRLVHLDHQVRDMLVFARGETRLAEQMTTSELLNHLQQAAETSLARANAHCSWVAEGKDERILCNKETLIGALLNLMQNSIEASTGKPELQVRLSTNGGKAVCIEIEDKGAGFNAQQQAKILEAFYTTKTQGTGLGLAVVQAVVKAHQGCFSLVSEGPGQGARAIITLPVFKAAVTAQAAVA